MLKDRLRVAALGIPLIVLVLWLGGVIFAVFFCAVAMAALVEFYRISAGMNHRSPALYLGLLWALALLLRSFYPSVLLPTVLTAGLLLSLLLLFSFSPRERAFFNWAWLVVGVWYIGWMLGYWLELRSLPSGRDWAFLAAFATFACDTGAYAVGRAWGTHRVAPAISPGKTWEGALGGFGSALLIALAACAAPVFIAVELACWQLIVAGCLAGLAAQVGDLVESLLKRNMGVKESGTLLPGHGGVLDRFDGFIFVGPVMYYYALWVTG